MKKTLSILAAIFFIATTTWAQTASKYTSANLNLREKASTSGKVLTVLPKGTEVKIEKNCDCEWILVSYKGNIGYVYSKYLTSSKQVYTSSLSTTSSNVKYYTNTQGERVQSPTYYKSTPAGATALCRDGTYSFSRNRRGTCSRHGGVARWL